MGKIHVLPELVANQIAAGEVVERPASVVKELLENSLDAGATRIRLAVEGGGRRLIHIVDDGCGMLRDDALLAFERHATSKLRTADDLLSIATLGFRGEALPSIAAVSRLRLETRAAEEPSGSVVEVAGGRILRVEEAGLPVGTSIAVRDLFFNTPARRKFLKSEATELSHIASLVTHYALAHPDKHFELHSAANAVLVAPPVADKRERIYQIFGREVLDELLPVVAQLDLARAALSWGRTAAAPPAAGPDAPEPAVPAAGQMRLHGFASRPEVQKLNRNSIFIFVNGRLIRDRLVQHALTEAYRNLMPPTVYPVVLLFLELPFGEVDVNVHPSKTEVRFRQQSLVHDFVRDSIRAALMKARPVAAFTRELQARPDASPALTPSAPLPPSDLEGAAAEGAVPPADAGLAITQADADFLLHSHDALPQPGRLAFSGTPIDLPAALEPTLLPQSFGGHIASPDVAAALAPEDHAAPPSGEDLAALTPLAQVQDSFILATTGDSLWIIDQHVAHERVLFEQVLRQRAADTVHRQRLLLPLILELTPAQQAVFADIAGELERNGFEVEPFGVRTIAVKSAPAAVVPAEVEPMLHELLEQLQEEKQALNLEILRRRIAAGIACHGAIKANMPLAMDKMRWLLGELARTEFPMSCPHGRPVVLRYSFKEIRRAFKRL
jgi:DNA mismatch repair protein MutL